MLESIAGVFSMDLDRISDKHFAFKGGDCNQNTFMHCKLLFKKVYCLFSIVIFIVFGLSDLKAQDYLDQKITIEFEQSSLEDALYQLAETAKVSLSFSSDLLPPKTINQSFDSIPLRQILKDILKNTGVGYKNVSKQLVLYKLPIVPKKKYTLSGFIEDKETGERLISANIYCLDHGRGTSTNDYGFYSLSLVEDSVDIRVSYLGYESITLRKTIKEDISLNVALKPVLNLTEILVVANPLEEDTTKSEYIDEETNTPSLDLIKKLPSLGGEADILNAMEALPGVQGSEDGLSGIHIRGAGTEHNLTLIDGTPIYYLYHLFGVFSVLNSSSLSLIHI